MSEQPGATENTDKAQEAQAQRLRPVLESGVIKAFVAGIVVGNLNKGMMLGFLVGALGGVYVQQTMGAPDIAVNWRKLVEKWQTASRGGKS